MAGTVAGLGERGTLTLDLNGIETVAITSDGGFSFEREFFASDEYHVTIVEQPERAQCEIAVSEGVVAGLKTAPLRVDCFGTDATLLDLGVSTVKSFTSGFDPLVMDYDLELSVLVQELRLRPITSDADATITIDDVEVASNTFSARLPLPLGSTVLKVVVTAPDSTSKTYSVRVKRGEAKLRQWAYGKANTTAEEDTFAAAVDISGDTLVVGAPWEAGSATGVDGSVDNLARGRGAAYVFRLVDGVWQQEAYLKASLGNSHQFGLSVAIDGDTIVVATPFEASKANGIDGDQSDTSAFHAGAAYVFRRNGSVWTQEAYVKASNTGSGDLFGISVDVLGDTMVVGASGESSAAVGVDANQSNDDAPGSGAAYVFHREGTTWQQQAYIKASNTDSSDNFGGRVALSGDQLAISAPNEDSRASGVNGDDSTNGAGDSGAVYVFRRTGTTWHQEAYLKQSNNDLSDTGDLFGIRLAFDGDTIAVGAILESSKATGVNGLQSDNSKPNSGAVYIFRRADSTWAQEAYIKASNTGAYNMFGFSVALAGNVLAVGANDENGSATGIDGSQNVNDKSGSGAVYLFRREGSDWRQAHYIKASNSESQDRFGVSLALSGDTLVVGAEREDSEAKGFDGDQDNNSATDSGALYIFQ